MTTALATTKASVLGALFAATKTFGSATGLHIVRDPSAESWSDAAIGTMTFKKEVKGVETFTEVRDIPCVIRNGHTNEIETYTYDGRTRERYSGVYKPTKGFWYLAYNETLLAVLEGLPARAEVSFEVYLDAGTNEPLVKARMHSDFLYLVAKWTSGKKTVTRRFLIDVSTGEHNTARFGNSRIY